MHLCSLIYISHIFYSPHNDCHKSLTLLEISYQVGRNRDNNWRKFTLLSRRTKTSSDVFSNWKVFWDLCCLSYLPTKGHCVWRAGSHLAARYAHFPLSSSPNSSTITLYAFYFLGYLIGLGCDIHCLNFHVYWNQFFFIDNCVLFVPRFK